MAVTPQRLFFAADDGIRRPELWRSDGTAPAPSWSHDLSRPGGLLRRRRCARRLRTWSSRATDDGLRPRAVEPRPRGNPTPARRRRPALCLDGGRFRVDRAGATSRATAGRATPVPLTADTGYFWFFDAANVELVVKVLDGRRRQRPLLGLLRRALERRVHADRHRHRRPAPPGATSTRAGQLRERRRHHGLRPAAARFDARRRRHRAAADRRRAGRRVAPTAAAAGACAPRPTRLCLNGGRFAVEVDLERLRRAAPAPGTAVAAHRRHRLLLVLRRRQRRAGGQGARRPGAQRPVLGLLRRAVERRVHAHRDRHRDRRRPRYRNPSGRLASVADTGAF